MPPLKKLFVYFLLNSFYLACLCSAQNVGGKIELQFITFPALTGDEVVELYNGKEEPVAIDLPSTRLSKVYTIENLATCVLGKTIEGDNGKSSFIKYGESPQLISKKYIILVSRKGNNLSDGLALIAFDASDTGLSGGEYLMINASTVDIAGLIGTERFLVKSNGHQMVSPEPSRQENGRSYMHIKMYYRKSDSAQAFYSNVWRYSDSIRCIVFIYHDPHTRQLRTRTIRSFVKS